MGMQESTALAATAPVLEIAHIRVIKQALVRRIEATEGLIASQRRSINTIKNHGIGTPAQIARRIAHLENQVAERSHTLSLLRESFAYFDGGQ